MTTVLLLAMLTLLTTNTWAQSTFSITSGSNWVQPTERWTNASRMIPTDCITDGPGNYTNNETATITINRNGSISAEGDFSVDLGSRFEITCNRSNCAYHGNAPTWFWGTRAPYRVPVRAGDVITWRSGPSHTQSGWTLCFLNATEVSSCGDRSIYSSEDCREECSKFLDANIGYTWGEADFFRYKECTCDFQQSNNGLRAEPQVQLCVDDPVFGALVGVILGCCCCCCIAGTVLYFVFLAPKNKNKNNSPAPPAQQDQTYQPTMTSYPAADADAPPQYAPPQYPHGGYPPAPPTGFYPPAPPTGGYPPAPPTGGYPPAPPTGGYPPAPPTGGYPPAPPTGGYPPAPPTGGYPPAPPTGGYPPAPPTGGYPPAPPTGFYPPAPQQGGYPPETLLYPQGKSGFVQSSTV